MGGGVVTLATPLLSSNGKESNPMLFTEHQLSPSPNPFRILDEAVYLTEEESKRLPQTVPIVENRRLGTHVVSYQDLLSVSEGYGVGLVEALTMVATSSSIDPTQVVVSIDEADAIEDPTILMEDVGYVLSPISESDPEAICTRWILEALTEDDQALDEGLCVQLLSEVTYEELTKMLNNLKDQRDQGSKPFTKDETKEWRRFMRQVHPDLHQNSVDASSSTISAVQDFIKRMGGLNQNQNRRRPGPGPAGFGGNQAAAVDRYLNYALKAYTGLAVGSLLSKAGAMAYAYKNRPKSFIAKRIAALRSLYQKMLYDAQYNPSKAGIIKQAAAKVLGIIDKLMAVLQKAADGRLKGYATPMVM